MNQITRYKRLSGIQDVTSKRLRVSEVARVTGETCMDADEGGNGQLNYYIRHKSIALEEQGMSFPPSPPCDDQNNFRPSPSVNSNLMVRRRFIHIKREARAIHTSQQDVHVVVTQEIESVMTDDVGVAGFVLPPPSQ